MFGFRDLVKNHGAEKAERSIISVIKEEKTTLSKFSMRELYEAFSAKPLYIEEKKGYQVKNISEDVNTSAFSNILGVLLTNEVIAAYQAVKKIGDMLVKPYNSRLLNERMPGFTSLENIDNDINEGEPYPESGFTDKYIDIPDPKKKGRIIYITEEAIYYDQTAMIVEQAQRLGERIAETREKRIISGVCGGHACYFPLGVSTALYSGTPQLVGSNALVDWTDIEKAELDGLHAMEDETGEQIQVMPKIVLVPRALYRTALRILNATQITTLTGSTIDTYSVNPYANELQALTSDYVSTYTSNSTSWFIGDPQKQFRWKEIWPIQTFRLAEPSLLQFQKDVSYAYKVRYKGEIFAIDNKYFVKNNA